MAELLDQVARMLAAGGSRREALRTLGVMLAGAALAGLLPKQVQAAPPCGGRCLANQCCNNGTCIAKCPFGTCCTGGSCEKSCPGDQCCDTVNGVCVANGKCPGPNNRPGCCDRATRSPLAICLAACRIGDVCTNGTCPCTPSQCTTASAGHACLPNGTCGCTSAADCLSLQACGATSPATCASACDKDHLCNGGCCSAASNGTCQSTCTGTGQSCGGGGIPGVCGCTDNGQACLGKCSLTVTNNCGQQVLCSCPSGQCCESNACVARDLQTDPLNCGTCGTHCHVAEKCTAGVCKCPKTGCSSPSETCCPEGSNPPAETTCQCCSDRFLIVSTTTCPNPFGSGCVDTCPSGTTPCVGSPGSSHCGQSGNPAKACCPAGTTCDTVNGTCFQ